MPVSRRLRCRHHWYIDAAAAYAARRIPPQYQLAITLFSLSAAVSRTAEASQLPLNIAASSAAA